MKNKTNIAAQIKSAAEIIGSTLGPKGRLCAITKDGETILTKDGYKVSQNLSDKTPGANFVRQVCRQQVRKIGDGTTSVAVLLAHLIDYPLKDLYELRAQIPELKSYLEANANKKIDREALRKIAMVASNGDESISDAVADVVSRNGRDGHYIVEEHDADGITTEQIKGYVMDAGYSNQAFANTKTGAELKQPIIFVKDFITLSDIAEPATAAMNAGRPFLVIGQCDEQALASLVANHLKGVGQFCNINPSQIGNKRRDVLADLTKLSQHITVAHVRRRSATFEYKNDSEIKKWIDTIAGQSAETPAEKAWRRERIAKLESKIAKIYVGAETTAQMIETKDRLEDTLLAVIQSYDGFIKGGGTALENFAPTKHKVWRVIHKKIGIKNIPDDVIEPINLIYQTFKTAVEQAILVKRTDYAI